MKPNIITPDGVESSRVWRPSLVLVVLLLNFGLLGITIGVQGVLWADVMTNLRLSAGVFGTAQLVAPLIAIALLLVGGRLSAWLGMQRLAVGSLLFLGISSLALGVSAGLWGLVGALVLVGIGNGLFETAMNGAALDWEAAQGRHALNWLHAGFSGGAVVGALVAGWLLGHGWTPTQLFNLVAGVCAVLLLATLAIRFPPSEAHPDDTGGLGATIRLLTSRRVLLALALIAMLGSVGENVAILWSVILLRERGADAVIGGTAFALFNGAMMLGRISNAPLVSRWGARTSLVVSGVSLLLSTVLLLAPGGLWLAIVGFALLGVAVAGVVPTVLSVGAKIAPGQSGALAGGMLAAVYASFVVAPPIIGWLAELFSLQAALLTVGVCGVLVLCLIREVPA